MTSILHLSDPHFGAADPEAARAFLATAAALRPDITLLSGDLTMRSRHAELDAAKNFYQHLPSPRMVIPGNHDVPAMNNLIERFLNPFHGYKTAFGDNLEPEGKFGNVHVVSINSSRAFGMHSDWSEGRISRRQFSSIRERFAPPTFEGFRVLMLHHPLLELQVAGRAVVKPLQPLLQVMEDVHIDLVVCGHFHRSQILATGLTGNWKSIISQAPTVCSTRLQGEPQGFHMIHFDGESARVVHHVYDQGSFTEGATNSFARSTGGWAPTQSP